MKSVHVQMLDQNDEDAGTLSIPLIRTTHVRRAIEERLRGEQIISIEKTKGTGWTPENGDGAVWIARIAI